MAAPADQMQISLQGNLEVREMLEIQDPLIREVLVMLDNQETLAIQGNLHQHLG